MNKSWLSGHRSFAHKRNRRWKLSALIQDRNKNIPYYWSILFRIWFKLFQTSADIQDTATSVMPVISVTACLMTMMMIHYITKPLVTLLKFWYICPQNGQIKWPSQTQQGRAPPATTTHTLLHFPFVKFAFSTK